MGTVAPLVDRVKSAVVTIQSTKFIRRFAVEDPWTRMMREQFGAPAPQGRREKQEGLGSGFIVDRSGIVLTNNHVVAGADEVIVQLADNRRFSAKVLGSDPPTDVAVVRIDKPPPDLVTANLGDSDRVRVGDYVLAIGNPLGLGQTVTMGIVSAKNRVIGGKLGDIDPRYEDFIQTDAAINQGNSGGPLFNFRGEVIGINAAIINPGMAMNVGFAIPINLARSIADQIRRNGRVARGYLGINGEDFTPERATELRTPFVAGRADQRRRPRNARRGGRAAPQRRRRRVRGQGDRQLPPAAGRGRAAAPGREGQDGVVAAGPAYRGDGDAGCSGRQRRRRDRRAGRRAAQPGAARSGGAGRRGRGRPGRHRRRPARAGERRARGGRRAAGARRPPGHRRRESRDSRRGCSAVRARR